MQLCKTDLQIINVNFMQNITKSRQYLNKIEILCLDNLLQFL